MPFMLCFKHVHRPHLQHKSISFKTKSKPFYQSVSKCLVGHLLFSYSAIFWRCCQVSCAHSFLRLSLSGHSVWVKQNSQEPTRAALRRLVPCPLLEPWLFCCNDLKPTISERRIKNDYEFCVGVGWYETAQRVLEGAGLSLALQKVLGQIPGRGQALERWWISHGWHLASLSICTFAIHITQKSISS